MPTLPLVLRRVMALVLVGALGFVGAGCGGGGGGGGGGSSTGGLVVAADFFSSNDAIYRVVVTETFFPGTVFDYDNSAAPSLWIDPGESLFIDDFFPGSYQVDVFWTDGFFFPDFADTHFVNIFAGFDAVEHFPS